MRSFKEHNESWEQTRVIIIDKDFTESKVRAEEIPMATILYCQWHVLKALFKSLSYHDIDKSKLDECRQLLRKLVYAKDEEKYDSYKEELFSICDNDKFKEYFEIHWNQCLRMWVTYERDNYEHYANTTNNCLESQNQKIKDVTSRSSSLSKMFDNLLLYIHTCEMEYSHQSFTEEFTTPSCIADEIPEASQLFSIFTQYAPSLVAEQLTLSNSVPYVIEETENFTSVSHKNNKHVVTSSSCDCSSVPLCIGHVVISLQLELS